MGDIVVVGLGPGPVRQLTWEAREELLGAGEVYLRVADHPAAAWLRENGVDVVSFDPIYALPGMTYTKVYETIVKSLVAAARNTDKVVFGVPGHPYVFEKTPRLLADKTRGSDIEVRVVNGQSFLEMIYSELGIDPEEGLQIINGFNFGYYGGYPFTEKLGLLIGQVGFPRGLEPGDPSNNAAAVMGALLEKFPPDHLVTLVWSEGMPDYNNRTRTFALGELADQSGFDRHLASLYVPPIRPPWEWFTKK